MAKKKRKTNPAISDPKPEASEQIVNSDEVSTAEKNEISESAEDSDASTEPEVSETDVSEEKSAEEDEIIVSEETLAEIGEPDKELIFKKVAKAYEEAKTKREKYKKIGPIFVAASGVAFLTLIFSDSTKKNPIRMMILKKTMGKRTSLSPLNPRRMNPQIPNRRSRHEKDIFDIPSGFKKLNQKPDCIRSCDRNHDFTCALRMV